MLNILDNECKPFCNVIRWKDTLKKISVEDNVILKPDSQEMSYVNQFSLTHFFFNSYHLPHPVLGTWGIFQNTPIIQHSTVFLFGLSNQHGRHISFLTCPLSAHEKSENRNTAIQMQALNTRG